VASSRVSSGFHAAVDLEIAHVGLPFDPGVTAFRALYGALPARPTVAIKQKATKLR
jgi:hypothetical protein